MLTDPWASAPYPRDDLQRLFDRNVRTEERAKKGDRRPLSDELTFYELPIERRSIVLFPGQGSQYVGMGASLLACPGARNLFDAARHILGYDLLELCLSGPKAKLDQTMYCQPAVFVASLAAIEKLRVDQPDVISTLVATAGFSVGEYAALVLAGSIDFDQGKLRLE
jgi:acyl transferase domain-containing protein